MVIHQVNPNKILVEVFTKKKNILVEVEQMTSDLRSEKKEEI